MDKNKRRRIARELWPKVKPQKAEVLEHSSGLRFMRIGRNIAFDRSQMSDEAVELEAAARKDYALALPRLVAEEATSIATLLTKVPTLAALANLGVAAYLRDMENYRESESAWLSFHVEWPTRLLLSLPEPLDVEWEPGAFQDVIDSCVRLHSYLQSLPYSEYIRLRHDEPTAKDDVIAAHRLHQLNIRSLAYHHQTREWLLRLFKPFDADVMKLLGFSIEQAISYVQQMDELVNERVRQWMGRHRMLTSERGIPSGVPGEHWSSDQLAAFNQLSCQMSMELVQVVSFRPDELSPAESANAFLDQFSLGFGMAAAGRPRPSMEILHHPMVRTGDGSYIRHIPLLIDAIRPNLEAEIKRGSGWPTYEEHRGRSLEDAAAVHWSTAMPRARVYRNLEYVLEDGSPAELDILCVIDRVLVLCECKSGALQPRAGQGTMLRSLRRLLGKAHRQALRARDHITTGSGEFHTDDGESITFKIDDFDHVFLVLVTLDDVSAFTTNMAQALGARIFADGQIPWAVSITDLEIMAELAELNVVLPHYLIRRTRMASHRQLHAIEEMDWFMHYLKDGLWFDDDLESLAPTALLSFTDSLDAYYYSKFGERSPSPKPCLELSGGYRDLLSDVETSTRPGWLEAALLLIDVSTVMQRAILSWIKDLRKYKAEAGRAARVADYVVAVYEQPAEMGSLRIGMMEYLAAHMAMLDVSKGVVIGIDSREQYIRPIIGYIDARHRRLPNKSEAEFYLSKFRRTELTPND
jgi:hypothetical protein